MSGACHKKCDAQLVLVALLERAFLLMKLMPAQEFPRALQLGSNGHTFVAKQSQSVGSRLMTELYYSTPGCHLGELTVECEWNRGN